MQINTLVIDDHQAFTGLFFSALQNGNTNFVVKECHDLQCAFDILFEAKNSILYNLVVIDYNMPPSVAATIKNGADLAKMIRAKFPGTKIIMMADTWEPIPLQNVLQHINPEGILHKCDINRNCIPTIFEKVMNGEMFRSDRVVENIKILHRNDLNFDNYDRMILMYLSMGYQTIDLGLKVNLSVSTIKKRKQRMKEFFNIPGCSDIVLINIAKEKQVF